MPSKIALLQFDRCKPQMSRNGICLAAAACSHKLILQEKAGEMPMFSPMSCTGCGDCARACPAGAIIISRI